MRCLIYQNWMLGHLHRQSLTSQFPRCSHESKAHLRPWPIIRDFHSDCMDSDCMRTVTFGYVATPSCWSELCSISSPMRCAIPQPAASLSDIDVAITRYVSKSGIRGLASRRSSDGRYSANFIALAVTARLAL